MASSKASRQPFSRRPPYAGPPETPEKAHTSPLSQASSRGGHTGAQPPGSPSGSDEWAMQPPTMHPSPSGRPFRPADPPQDRSAAWGEPPGGPALDPFQRPSSTGVRQPEGLQEGSAPSSREVPAAGVESGNRAPEGSRGGGSESGAELAWLRTECERLRGLAAAKEGETRELALQLRALQVSSSSDAPRVL